MRDREALEALMSSAEAYIIALLREALVPMVEDGKRREATVSARFVLLNTIEQLDQELNGKPKQPNDVLG